MYPTDFEADTSHLTLAEDGAYNRLVRLMWMTSNCSLPDDNAWIKRRMRVDQETFDSVVLVVIAEFFKRKGGRIISPRLAREYHKTDLAHKKRVAAGSKGGKAKAAGSLDKDPSKAKAMPKQPEPEPEPYKEKIDTIVSTKNGADLFDEPPPPPKPKQKRATSIPENWVPSDKNIEDALSKNLSQQQIQNEGEKFRDHHTARGTTFKNWDAAWRTWVGNSLKFAAGRGSAPQRRGMAGRDVAEEIATDAIELARKAEAHGPDWGSA